MGRTKESRLRTAALGAVASATLLLAFGPRAASAQCCSVPDHAAAVSTKGSGANADSVCVLEISGMTCGACAAKAQKALSGVKGVKEAKVSYESKQAVVLIPMPSSKAKALVKAIEKAGFTAKVTGKGLAEPKESEGRGKKATSTGPLRCDPGPDHVCMARAG